MTDEERGEDIAWSFAETALTKRLIDCLAVYNYSAAHSLLVAMSRATEHRVNIPENLVPHEDWALMRDNEVLDRTCASVTVDAMHDFRKFRCWPREQSNDELWDLMTMCIHVVRIRDGLTPPYAREIAEKAQAIGLLDHLEDSPNELGE